MRIDLFCRVIDNWGDAGVCWRLARQLVRERGASVRLWIDQPQVLNAWLGELSDMPLLQVYAWDEARDWSAVTPADCVIEAFACEIPAEYVANMAQSVVKPRWLNLEYLSAEAWVEGAHLLPSPQSGGLNKVFFFPGFTERTGGLLRERDLLANRDCFVAQHPRYWSDVTGFEWEPHALKISLFGYDNMPLQAWLPALIDGEAPVQLAVTAGKASEALKQAWGALKLPYDDQCDGESIQWQAGQLSVRFLPMLTQVQYDQLLWCADINMVRGEDSFVRALWAGKPLTWDIYKQDDDVHWEKLRAFAQIYGESLPESIALAWSDWLMLWNAGTQADEAQLRQAWERWVVLREPMRQAAQQRSAALAQQSDLLDRLWTYLSIKSD